MIDEPSLMRERVTPQFDAIRNFKVSHNFDSGEFTTYKMKSSPEYENFEDGN